MILVSDITILHVTFYVRNVFFKINIFVCFKFVFHYTISKAIIVLIFSMYVQTHKHKTDFYLFSTKNLTFFNSNS